jgi:hypothetical protein
MLDLLSFLVVGLGPVVLITAAAIGPGDVRF